jgi:hypothetical protein
LRHRGKREKQILTLQGWLTIRRSILKRKVDGSREVPIDNFLHIKKLPFKATALAMARAAQIGQASVSYRDAEETYKQILGISITDSYIHDISEYVGKKYFKEDERAAGIWEDIFSKGKSALGQAQAVKTPEKPTREGVFYIMIDGSMINIRQLVKGLSSWKEVKLALFFAGKDAKISADGETIRITKKDYAQWLGSVDDFKNYVFEAAVRNHCFEYEKIVILSDGAEWIKQMCGELFPGCVMILDFFHMADNVNNFARYIFKDDEKKYRPWAQARIECLKYGYVKEVLEDVKRYKRRKCPEGVVNPYTYLTKNAGRINYAEYRAAGYYIGSGPIESANKTFVQRRFKQAGMRWDEEEARHLFALRNRRQSGRWKEVQTGLLAQFA